MPNESPQVIAIRARYKASFNEKRSLINEYVEKLKDDQVDSDEAYQELHSELHKLAGSSGMYGYDDISLTCRSIMREIKSECFQEVVIDLERLSGMFCKYMKDECNDC